MEQEVNVTAMMEEIDLRFKSGNEVPVTWARIHVEEWKVLHELSRHGIMQMLETATVVHDVGE